MRQIACIIISGIFLFCSCHTVKDKFVQDPFPLILDTTGIEINQFSFDDSKPTLQITSKYRPYYIGSIKDTIYPDPFINFSPLPPPLKMKGSKKNNIKEIENSFKKYYIEWTEKTSFKNWTQAKVELRIDTALKMSKLYPLLLINKDVDTCLIGYGNYIPIMMEALDSTQNWQPIQKVFIYQCGVGIGSIILPPHECLLTFAPIFNGSYKTKLRVAIGNNHSEPFDGSITYGQFRRTFLEE